MNHDAAHCLDYDKKKCPKSCYRAKLTQEYIAKKIEIDFPTSWVHFAGTKYCVKERVNNG